MKYTKKDFTVGQTLWVKSTGTRNNPYIITIEKVGNKLLTCKLGRKVNIEEMCLEKDFGYRDKVYLSETAYLEIVELKALHSNLIQKVTSLPKEQAILEKANYFMDNLLKFLKDDK